MEEAEAEALTQYLAVYDAVITGDADMDFVLRTLDQLSLSYRNHNRQQAGGGADVAATAPPPAAAPPPPTPPPAAAAARAVGRRARI